MLECHTHQKLRKRQTWKNKRSAKKTYSNYILGEAQYSDVGYFFKVQENGAETHGLTSIQFKKLGYFMVFLRGVHSTYNHFLSKSYVATKSSWPAKGPQIEYSVIHHDLGNDVII